MKETDKCFNCPLDDCNENDKACLIRDPKKEGSARYREKHREVLNIKSKKYYRENRQAALAKKKVYYLKNKHMRTE